MSELTEDTSSQNHSTDEEVIYDIESSIDIIQTNFHQTNLS